MAMIDEEKKRLYQQTGQGMINDGNQSVNSLAAMTGRIQSGETRTGVSLGDVAPVALGGVAAAAPAIKGAGQLAMKAAKTVIPRVGATGALAIPYVAYQGIKNLPAAGAAVGRLAAGALSEGGIEDFYKKINYAQNFENELANERALNQQIQKLAKESYDPMKAVQSATDAVTKAASEYRAPSKLGDNWTGVSAPELSDEQRSAVTAMYDQRQAIDDALKSMREDQARYEGDLSSINPAKRAAAASALRGIREKYSQLEGAKASLSREGVLSALAQREAQSAKETEMQKLKGQQEIDITKLKAQLGERPLDKLENELVAAGKEGDTQKQQQIMAVISALRGQQAKPTEFQKVNVGGSDVTMTNQQATVFSQAVGKVPAIRNSLMASEAGKSAIDNSDVSGIANVIKQNLGISDDSVAMYLANHLLAS